MTLLETLIDKQASPQLFETACRYYLPLGDELARRAIAQRHTLVVGVCGGQGSGKSTLCHLLAALLRQRDGLNCATLSIDDLYFNRAERLALAQRVHPLLQTRGVPGTHDVKLGKTVLQGLISLQAGEQLAVPRFNKSSDDPEPRKRWPVVSGPVDIVFFEGWCVGAKAVADTELLEAVNSLEAEEDRELLWRRYVNRQLQGPYRQLFSCVDSLIMLQVPDMEAVLRWRTEQEQKLTHPLMNDRELQRFVQHYERVTLQILRDMPAYADFRLQLNQDHGIDHVWHKQQELKW